MKDITQKIEGFLEEAEKARRAWSGKIKRIDALLSWLYDKNILTATEKKEKDKIFRQYYRYYNDGDLPAAMRKQGHGLYDTKHRNMNASGELALEKYLDAFIKKILSKYMPKIDRSEFRIDKSIKELSKVKEMIDEGWNVNHVIEYWVKKVKIVDDSGEFADLVSNAQQYLNILKEATNNKNKSINYLRDEMKKDKTWSPEMEKVYINLMYNVKKMGTFIGNLIIGFEKARDLKKVK